MKLRTTLLLLLMAAMAVLAASMPGAAGAAAKKETTTGKDAGANVSIVGPGHAKGTVTVFGLTTFKFSAKSSKGAAAPDFPATGKYSIKVPSTGQFVQGKVQCLEVDNTGGANFAGPVTKSNAVPVGTPIGFNAFDSGEPKGQGDLFSGGSAVCSPPNDSGLPLTSGNIVVTPA